MITSDLDDTSDLRGDVLSQASLACQKFEKECDIARHIKAFLDSKYQPGWHCIVGKSFNCSATYEAKTYAFFEVGPMAILVFKA